MQGGLDGVDESPTRSNLAPEKPKRLPKGGRACQHFSSRRRRSRTLMVFECSSPSLMGLLLGHLLASDWHARPLDRPGNVWLSWCAARTPQSSARPPWWGTVEGSGLVDCRKIGDLLLTHQSSCSDSQTPFELIHVRRARKSGFGSDPEPMTWDVQRVVLT